MISLYNIKQFCPSPMNFTPAVELLNGLIAISWQRVNSRLFQCTSGIASHSSSHHHDHPDHHDHHHHDPHHHDHDDPRSQPNHDHHIHHLNLKLRIGINLATFPSSQYSNGQASRSL